MWFLAGIILGLLLKQPYLVAVGGLLQCLMGIHKWPKLYRDTAIYLTDRKKQS